MQPSGCPVCLARPSGVVDSGMATWQKAALLFAALGFAGLVYLSRPESDEEKLAYTKLRSRRSR